MNELEQRVRDLDEKGYCLIDDVISSEQCANLRNILNECHEKYSSKYFGAGAGTAHGLQDKSDAKVVYNMHNKSMDFFPLFRHRVVLDIMDVVLRNGSYKKQDPYNLYNISARTPKMNSGYQQLHNDSRLPGGKFPLVMVALWMLNDFTIENGATRVVPGSHRFTIYPEDRRVYDEEIIVTAKEGSVLIFDGGLWHGGGNNVVPDERWAIILGYGRWFIKPSFDFAKNTPREIYDQMTDEDRALLGYNTFPPKDEFTRLRRIGAEFECPGEYHLPSS